MPRRIIGGQATYYQVEYPYQGSKALRLGNCLVAISPSNQWISSSAALRQDQPLTG
ncbi:hypothetical protein FOVG_09752 [Fusarium oxysporum f. sp. pisi HDV247]|uniref:Uncharacterized protein n=1 Tax=Fusarium oxysporum f. sp. pisi HDV247 TaxID=1080344 RepID=W9PE17_FUSOX|nr:hypothetical protein FOVG_09752 [Fusarium oxysporum f. sp. pisi HDV247]